MQTSDHFYYMAANGSRTVTYTLFQPLRFGLRRFHQLHERPLGFHRTGQGCGGKGRKGEITGKRKSETAGTRIPLHYRIAKQPGSSIPAVFRPSVSDGRKQPHEPVQKNRNIRRNAVGQWRIFHNKMPGHSVPAALRSSESRNPRKKREPHEKQEPYKNLNPTKKPGSRVTNPQCGSKRTQETPGYKSGRPRLFGSAAGRVYLKSGSCCYQKLWGCATPALGVFRVPRRCLTAAPDSAGKGFNNYFLFSNVSVMFIGYSFSAYCLVASSEYL